MNFFRSEDHVKNWSGYKEGTYEAMLSIDDLMSIFETPRHSDKFTGHYVSSAPEYAPAFYERLKMVTDNSPFWLPPA